MTNQCRSVKKITKLYKKKTKWLSELKPYSIISKYLYFARTVKKSQY